MAKVFGIASNSGLTGFSGAIVGVFTVSADGDTKVLRGNPSSEIADIRFLKNATVLTIDIVGFEGSADPETLVGTDLTVSIGGEGGGGGVSSFVGTVIAAKITGNYDNWWTASITMSKKPTPEE